jgi:amino acid transporter
MQIEQPAILRGTLPGERFVRLQRPGSRRFARRGETLVATDVATAPRDSLGRFWKTIRRIAVGLPLSTGQLEQEKLSKVKALAVFSSDALSSSAYATDEILIALTAAGSLALGKSVPLAMMIALLLAIVAFSYRQTIRAYPGGGGAYIVAKDNLGDGPGLAAAAALSVDYILTVAVSIAAGVLAIVSAFPGLDPYRVELALAFISLITLANLRGLSESGTLFAIPTYGFLLSFGGLLIFGVIKVISDPGLVASPPENVYAFGSSPLTVFLLLKAFSSGCTALTGIEAISNGIPAFKSPEAKNASTTLTWMAVILATLFLGITFLAHQLHVQPSEDVSVAAQVGQTVFGHNVFFYTVQAFTALILILAANTSYADFPRLASILAQDRFMPPQFMFRGDRLAFSRGILLLGLGASCLVIVFQADVTRLIPLYAFGVFVSFTLSQGGMVRHWFRLREPGWRRYLIINGIGATATLIVAVIVGGTKFAGGAWISMLAMVILALLFFSIHRHYVRVQRQLSLDKDIAPMPSGTRRSPVVIPIDGLTKASLRALNYARSISDVVVGLHVTDDVEAAAELREEWNARAIDTPLVIVDSPYRSFIAPVISYLEAVQEQSPNHEVTVVLPVYQAAYPWQQVLHNQIGKQLRSVLRDHSGIVTTEIVYHLDEA